MKLRRAPLVIAATVAGMAAVLSFKPHEPSLPSATAATPPEPSSGGSSRSSRSSSSSSSRITKTVTGNAIATRYGNAQVKVTIKDGRITAIQALQLQANEPKSVQISGQAEPILQQEALQKQSAAIDAVSGATITSASYEASLQSALDKAGFRAADGSRGTSTIPDVEEHDDHGGPNGGDGGVPPGFTPPQG
ncbi:FMN-binding protein [Conexibacter woesei]|uniref:FMN-binding protein n=1 Tax=Conexibacter woesei TaxID=191495 RepID=UPI000685A05B|nr:FMN-binding protein [Conexibacter woesei]